MNTRLASVASSSQAPSTTIGIRLLSSMLAAAVSVVQSLVKRSKSGGPASGPPPPIWRDMKKAGERAARRTFFFVAPASLLVLVGVKQRRQFRAHEAEMARLRGVLMAELAMAEDQHARVLVLAPQLAGSAGACAAGVEQLASVRASR